jgi:23S rRNA A2030 N6-methylase RlmJ
MSPLQNLNAGNEGDVWKHKVLLTVASVLLEERTANCDYPFRYFESHAGRGEFPIEESTGWRRGIGHALDRTPNHKRDLYLDLEASSRRQNIYMGSWRLMKSLLSTRSRTWSITLYDNDPQVIAYWGQRYEPQSGIAFCRGDGFAAACNAEADLILADPFKAWTQSARLATAIPSRNFLIWYPIVRFSRPDQLVKATDLIGCEALWAPPRRPGSRSLCGCGLLMSRPVAERLPVIVPTLLAFATLLGWQLHLRVPWEVA